MKAFWLKAWVGMSQCIAPCQEFLDDLSTMKWGPCKVIIYHQNVIISPKKCAHIPQNRSFKQFWENLVPLLKPNQSHAFVNNGYFEATFFC